MLSCRRFICYCRCCFTILLATSIFKNAQSDDRSSSSLLHRLCSAYFNVTSAVRTQFTNSICTVRFAIPHVNYWDMRTMCDSAFEVVSAQCQLPRLTLQEINDRTNEGFLTVDDLFFLGLTREGCTDRWYWVTGNGSLSDSSLTLSASDCSLTAAAFENGSIIAVNPDNFMTSCFVCQCYDMSSESLNSSSNVANSKTVVSFISGRPGVSSRLRSSHFALLFLLLPQFLTCRHNGLLLT